MYLYVILTERPDPPVNINVSGFGSRWVVLDWTPDFNGNRPIEKYMIYWENLNTTTMNMTEERAEEGTLSYSFMFNISSGIPHSLTTASQLVPAMTRDAVRMEFLYQS